MSKDILKKYCCFLSILVFIFILSKCGTYKRSVYQADSGSVSPVLSPAQALKRFIVEDGFEVKLVASEPLISAPVALTFDEKGRIWVVEMNAYMPDTAGTGENEPTGKIVILEDKNTNSEMDTRKVFLDSLLLPRAICLIENGLLVAEPPRLWYYPINNDKPGKRVLVDAAYAEGGNVEHSPNGLLRAMDNWIYNAKSSKRYRKNGDKWIIEQTHFRGQWGISQDNFGRLYYNDNSTNLIGDYFSPGFGAGNKNQPAVAGFNERIVNSNRVYPAHATPGVNRGYMPGVLDDSLRLVNFTAACGPLIYRGALFDSAFDFNAFVAEPSANLIKRNLINMAGTVTSGTQAYQKKEFLASTDERFRPVNLYNGPDGGLYITDMYRGIIQHETYLTPYLKKEIVTRKLTAPLNCGRIYKVVPKKSKAKAFKFPGDMLSLTKLLGHPNGWVRDRAQQLLVDSRNSAVVPALRENLKAANPLMVAHSIWVLEGLNALQTAEVLGLLKQPDWNIRMQALSVLPSVITQETYAQYLPVLAQMLVQSDTLAAPYLAFVSKYIKYFDKAAALNLLKSMAGKYPDNRYVADAVISNLQDEEETFQKALAVLVSDKNKLIHKQLQKIITANLEALAGRDPRIVAKEFPKGATLYSTICQTCHGINGEGRALLAPPLNRSQWVTGDKNKLASIVLMGLTGPVDVNGHLYKAPEINGDMPGIGASKDFSDDDVAQILSYIRRSWLNNADQVTAADIAAARQKLKGREKPFTAEELNRP